MDFKFKYIDIEGDNEYKVYFDVCCTTANEDECLLELDGDILLEDHNGNNIEYSSLSTDDRAAIDQKIEDWLDSEQFENGYNYYLDKIESMSDYYYETMGDR